MLTRRILLVLALLAAACSSSGEDAAPTSSTTDSDASSTTVRDNSAPADGDYVATIRRSEHNVPHIEAPDLGSLGFGYGYAIAEDHGCTIADIGVLARSERAKWHGPGPDDQYLNEDFVYRSLDLRSKARESFDGLDTELQDVIRGYAVGYNTYLGEAGADGLTGWCAGEPWVGPIDEYDLATYFHILAGYASIDPLLDFIATAEPPSVDDDEEALAPSFPDVLPDAEALGSNAWAIGPTRTLDGTTMLVGNPHFPWQGSQRFYEVHLTVPGELDVYGASLLGSPAVNIGFTEGVAWSHTVSAGHRFTVYTLALDEGDPTTYLYGDEVRRMTPTEVTIDVLQPDGSTAAVDRTMWSSHYGPILDFPGVGWSESMTLSFRDANADNNELFRQFFDMNQATTMDEFIDAHRTNTGIPWVNTVAASADGRIWYADTSAAPNLSPEAVDAYDDLLETNLLSQLGDDLGFIVLDGADPVFEWVDDPAARDPGVVSFDAMPQLERDDFVFNANDSYWIANPADPQVLDTPVFGRTEAPLSNRTRGNAVQLAEVGGDSGEDGLYTFEELVDAVFANRVYTAEELVDDVVAGCPVDLADACGVLAEWDRRVDLDSRGAVLWREFIDDIDGLWGGEFDADDPIGTPAGINGDTEEVAAALGAAVERLEDQGLDLDVALGDVQYAAGRPGRIPLHGGRGSEGVANVIGPGSNRTTTEPEIDNGDRTAGSFREGGYPINNGTSFVYALEFTADGPVARSLVTYGNTGDPESPFFSDQTQRFSDKDMKAVRFPLTEADIVSETSISAPR